MKIIETVEFDHLGLALQGYLALPEGPGPHPAVLVMHNLHGLGETPRRAARKLAEAGYVALASDMLGGARYSTDSVKTGEAAMPLLNDPALVRARTTAWFEWLRARPEVAPARMAVIGYCFGGQCVLELARSGADVKLVVSYHGTLKTTKPAQPGSVKAEAVIYTGGKDPYAPPEDVAALRDEMVAAGARWQITVFGEGYHSFTDPAAGDTDYPGLAYDPFLEKLSWAGTEVLLESLL